MQIMDTDGSLLEPLADERVRRALNLAIDREAFDEGLQFGQGDPSSSFWLPGTAYYDESLEELAYDPEQARALLAEAGYEDGFSVTFPSFGAIVPVAESVQQMWAEIGVDVTVELVEPGTLAAVMRNGETVMNPTIARGFTAESHYKERLAPGGPYDPIGTDRGQLAELAEAAYQAVHLRDRPGLPHGDRPPDPHRGRCRVRRGCRAAARRQRPPAVRHLGGRLTDRPDRDRSVSDARRVPHQPWCGTR
jgi:peptide/nickel transport system substrate-binding protein